MAMYNGVFPTAPTFVNPLDPNFTTFASPPPTYSQAFSMPSDFSSGYSPMFNTYQESLPQFPTSTFPTPSNYYPSSPTYLNQAPYPSFEPSLGNYAPSYSYSGEVPTMMAPSYTYGGDLSIPPTYSAHPFSGSFTRDLPPYGMRSSRRRVPSFSRQRRSASQRLLMSKSRSNSRVPQYGSLSQPRMSESEARLASLPIDWDVPLYSKYQPSGLHSDAVVPQPTGRRMALCAGVNPPNNNASTQSIAAVYEFLRRHNFSIHVVECGTNWENEWSRFQSDLSQAVADISNMATGGDSVIFYCIGYNCSTELSDFSRLLQPGVRLTCLMDSCYLSEKPAFRIDYKDTSGLAGSKVRQAKPMSHTIENVHPDIFLFEGRANTRDVASFQSMKGPMAIFTAAFIRAYTSKDQRGYWNQPTTYAQLCLNTEEEIRAIIKVISRKQKIRHVEMLACCSKPYDIDQPAFL